MTVQGAALSILVVDDEDLVRRLVVEVLRRAGFAVLEAHDGESALATLARDRVALVVTDVMMPRMSGIELLRAIRNECPDIPVVIVTGALDPKVRNAAAAVGATEILHKPFTHAELVDTVHEAYARRKDGPPRR